MRPLPYEFLCTRCTVRVESSAYDVPSAAGCQRGGEHEWVRQVDPRRVAAHEAAHAIAAAVLLGVGSVQSIRLERPSESSTLFLGRPDSPQALLIALSGPAASARTGDARDGAEGDLREFRRRSFTCLVRARGLRPDVMDDEAGAVALSRSMAIMRKAFESAAKDLVERREPSIDRLATQILERRVLEGRDLHRAIEEALANRLGEGFVSPVLDPDFALGVWHLAEG